MEKTGWLEEVKYFEEAGARSGINWPLGEIKKPGASGATD